MHQNKSYLPIILLAAVALIIGLLVGRQMTPNKEQVRSALYEACINGTGYDAKAGTRLGDSLGCNRRRIDLLMAAVYVDSYIDPMPDEETRALYESLLQKYKHR